MVKTTDGNEIELFNPYTGGILVVGVVHGDEPQGDYLIRKYYKETPDTKLIMIPCLNPDGMQKNSRTNSNGVDLNRNFPSQNWIEAEKNEYYGGKEPASEIETRFLMNVVEKYTPKAILTLHSPYKVVNYDGGKYEGIYGGNDARMLAQKISEIIGYPVEENIGYPTPGSFGTWAGIEKGIPVITLELDEEINIVELEKPVFDIFRMLENY